MKKQAIYPCINYYCFTRTVLKYNILSAALHEILNILAVSFNVNIVTKTCLCEINGCQIKNWLASNYMVIIFYEIWPIEVIAFDNST